MNSSSQGEGWWFLRVMVIGESLGVSMEASKLFWEKMREDEDGGGFGPGRVLRAEACVSKVWGCMEVGFYL